MLAPLTLEDRDLPSSAVTVAGRMIDPMPDFFGQVAGVDAGRWVHVGAGPGGGPRYQVYDDYTGVKVVDEFRGDPAGRDGLILVGVDVSDGLREGAESVPADVWRSLYASGDPGLQVVWSGRVTDHPAHRHVRGLLTADGRPFDDLAGVAAPATVRPDAPAWVVRHEVAHQYLPLLGIPIDDEAAAVRVAGLWGPTS